VREVTDPSPPSDRRVNGPRRAQNCPAQSAIPWPSFLAAPLHFNLIVRSSFVPQPPPREFLQRSSVTSTHTLSTMVPPPPYGQKAPFSPWSPFLEDVNFVFQTTPYNPLSPNVLYLTFGRGSSRRGFKAPIKRTLAARRHFFFPWVLLFPLKATF